MHGGLLMAIALIQDSSGFPFFSPCVYEHLCGKDVLSLTVTQQDVPVFEARKLLDQTEVRCYTNVSKLKVYSMHNQFAQIGNTRDAGALPSAH